MKLVTLLILALMAGPAAGQVTSGKDVDEVLKWEHDGCIAYEKNDAATIAGAAAMTPRGSLAYIAGLLVLFGGLGLVAVVMLFVFLLDQRIHREAVVFLVLSGIVVFGAAHLLAGGLYRMLVDLYRAISRTDPVGDRPLQGTRIYLLGQIASAMAIPMALMFIFVPDGNGPRDNRGVVLLLAGVPCAFFVMLSLVTFFAGLGLMVRDTFVRHRDIIEKRNAERRRRVDEADDPHTEVIPTVLPAELRAHVKEDR